MPETGGAAEGSFATRPWMFGACAAHQQPSFEGAAAAEIGLVQTSESAGRLSVVWRIRAAGIDGTGTRRLPLSREVRLAGETMARECCRLPGLVGMESLLDGVRNEVALRLEGVGDLQVVELVDAAQGLTEEERVAVWMVAGAYHPRRGRAPRGAPEVVR